MPPTLETIIVFLQHERSARVVLAHSLGRCRQDSVRLIIFLRWDDLVDLAFAQEERASQPALHRMTAAAARLKCVLSSDNGGAAPLRMHKCTCISVHVRAWTGERKLPAGLCLKTRLFAAWTVLWISLACLIWSSEVYLTKIDIFRPRNTLTKTQLWAACKRFLSRSFTTTYCYAAGSRTWLSCRVFTGIQTNWNVWVINDTTKCRKKMNFCRTYIEFLCSGCIARAQFIML